MRTDHKCLRTFIELWALPWRSVNDNWNVQINPLAAAHPCPSSCVSLPLVEHTIQNKPLFRCQGRDVESRFPIEHVPAMRAQGGSEVRASLRGERGGARKGPTLSVMRTGERVGLEDKELKLELRAGLLDFLVGLLLCVASLSLGVGLRVASLNTRAEALCARKIGESTAGEFVVDV